MQRIRSEFDYDRIAEAKPTAFRTSENRFELLCGMCGDAVFVDEVTFERLGSAVEQGLEDNPLLCAECEADLDEERQAE